MLVPIRMQRVPIGTLYVKKSLIPSLEGRGAVLIFDIFNNKDEDFEVHGTFTTFRLCNT